MTLRTAVHELQPVWFVLGATFGFVTSSKKVLIETVAELAGSLVPGLGPLTEAALLKVNEEWARNTSKALRAAERAAGMRREDLGDQLERDPRLVPLYIKLVYAAGMNGHDDTLRTMGYAFGSAARAASDGDDDGLADAEDALNAMRELGPRHFAVMLDMRLARPEPGPGLPGDPPAITASEIAARIDQPARVVKQCLLNLAAAGLVEEPDDLFGIAYELTDLGLAVIEAVETVYPEP